MSKLFWSFVFISVVLINGKTVFIRIPAEHATELIAASIDCIQKTGVHPDILQQLIDWTFTDDDRVKKFLYCFGLSSGFIDNNGHIKTDKMANIVGNNRRKDHFVNVINECNREVGKDEYDTIYKTALCFHDKTPILFKL